MTVGITSMRSGEGFRREDAVDTAMAVTLLSGATGQAKVVAHEANSGRGARK